MTTTYAISNWDDIIDSRDVIERLGELEADVDLNEDELDELRALRNLNEEGEVNSEDWRYGAVLVRDSYFEDYARQMAEDIGAISGDESWPLNHIDWAAAAKALQMDYTSVDFDGVDYWVR